MILPKKPVQSFVVLLAYTLLFLAVFLWPIYLGVQIAAGRVLGENISHSLGFCHYCGKTGFVINSIFVSVIMLALWWTLLGLFSYIKPKITGSILGPFKKYFKPAGALLFTLMSLFILILFVGAMVLSYTDIFKLGFA